MKSREKQAEISKGPLQRKLHRRYLTPRQHGDNPGDVSTREAHQGLSVQGASWGLIT